MKRKLWKINVCVALAAHFFCQGTMDCVRGQSVSVGTFEEWFASAVSGLSGVASDLVPDVGLDGVSDLEGLWEQYARLWDKGIDVVGADRKTLEQSGLFSAFQVESLLFHRATYGPVHSLEELHWVDGFPEAWIRCYGPFLRFGSHPGNQQRGGWTQEFVLRTTLPLEAPEEACLGPNVGGLLKYRIRQPGGLEAGVVLEQDVGEPWWIRQNEVRGGFPDYGTAYLCWEDRVLGKRQAWKLVRVVLGSYQLRLGQGLVAWKGFSMENKASPAQLLRRSEPLAVYRSSDEAQGLFGFGGTFAWRDWEGTIALSGRRLDARVREDRFYSLPTDGYHRTLSDWEQRKTLFQGLAAVSIRYHLPRGQLAFHGLWTGYDKEDGRTFTDYRRRTIYQRAWQNYGLEWRYAWASMQAYGEVAVDRRGALATLWGWEWAPVYACEVSAQLRYYEPDYTAPHAGAWSSGSRPTNEHSLTARALWRWGGFGSCSVHGAYVYYPASRYRVKFPSDAFEVAAQVNWSAPVWQFQFRWQWLEDPDYTLPKQNFRMQWGYLSPLGDAGFQVLLKWQGSVALSRDWGRAMAVQFGIQDPSVWELSATVVGYHAEAWEDRLYLYQRSLPGSFSFPVLYGRGMDVSLYAKYEPRRGLALYGGWRMTGLLEKQSEPRSEVKFQVQWTIRPF